MKVWDPKCQNGEGETWHSPFLTSFVKIVCGKGWRSVPVVTERDEQARSNLQGQ